MQPHVKVIAACALVIVFSVIFVTFYTALTQEAAFREQDPVYKEPLQRVSAYRGQNATSGAVTLRANSVSDDRNAAARSTWSAWSTYASDLYTPLNPVAGSRYVLINVTATNTMARAQPFRYADLVLVGSDGRLYYTNYAVCLAKCDRAVVRNQTLPANSANDVFVAYSVPSRVAPTKLVYQASRPQIVIDLGR